MKAVIFDMDGLMIDSEVVSYKCYKTLIESNGYTFKKEDYTNGFPGRTLIGSLQYIKEHYHLDYNIEDELAHFRKMEEEYSKGGMALKKGLKELLVYLKENNYKTIIATSSGKDRVLKLLEPHDILKYYDDIVCGSEVSNGKPAPDIFLKACEKLNVATSDALVLEDSEAGILAAYRADIKVICVPDLKYPEPKYQTLTYAILPSLLDVKEHLKQQITK